MYEGKERYIQGFSGGTEKKNQSEDPGIDGSIILRCIFRKWDVRAWTGLM
jgi:hypothetical protein